MILCDSGFSKLLFLTYKGAKPDKTYSSGTVKTGKTRWKKTLCKKTVNLALHHNILQMLL